MLLALTGKLTAQKVNKEEKGKAGAGKNAGTHSPVKAYLGRSDLNGGPISKQAFDSYLKQGLTARDSMGVAYRVDGFTFSYSERNLYEDSVGNLMILTDYLSEFCSGDTVSPAVANNIYYKTNLISEFHNLKI